MTTPIGYGVDLSHWQSPEQLPWASWLGKVDFVIARAGYGRTKDTSAVRHIARARDIGAKVGLYVFFRVVEAPADQFANLRAVVEAAGLDGRDIVPAIDIEAESDLPVAPSWSAHAEELVDRVVDRYGNALVYITQREWRMLGYPEWVLKRPLWAAHYRDGDPATPGNMPATIHQHRVGPFERFGAGGAFKMGQQIDQNRLLRPLPLIDAPLDPAEQSRIQGQVSMWLASEATRLGEPFPLEPTEKNS